MARFRSRPGYVPIPKTRPILGIFFGAGSDRLPALTTGMVLVLPIGSPEIVTSSERDSLVGYRQDSDAEATSFGLMCLARKWTPGLSAERRAPVRRDKSWRCLLGVAA
jgi:hypothetical protein